MDSLADIDEIARGRVGRTLREKWRLDALLGVGGMAAVYAGTHRNGKRGAVKVLHPELARSGDARARFLREGYVANAVDHPGAVAVIDDDATDDGLVFMVMELLQGSTLDALAEASPGRALPLDVVLKAADDLLDVLAAAHDNGIVHRDIKPENLFLGRDGALKVLDFGIARLKQGDGSVRATRTGDAMGTPAFMPPEQALGNWSEVDGRTDLWAVGATMFTLLSGRYVHEAETVQKMMLAAMTRDAPPLETVVSAPPPVCAAVNRALARQRDQRFPDARAMQAAIRAARVSHDGAASGPTPRALARVSHDGAASGPKPRALARASHDGAASVSLGPGVGAPPPPRPIVVGRDFVHAGAPTMESHVQGLAPVAPLPPSISATGAPTSRDRGAPAEARRRAAFLPLLIGLVGVVAGVAGVAAFLLSRSQPLTAASVAAPSTASSEAPPVRSQSSAGFAGSGAPLVEPVATGEAPPSASATASAGASQRAAVPPAAQAVSKGRLSSKEPGPAVAPPPSPAPAAVPTTFTGRR